MRILFVLPIPPPARNVYAGFPQGIGSLIALAKRAGHEVRFVMLWRVEKDFHRYLEDFGPDVVAFSITTSQLPLAASLASAVRAAGRARILVGGPHATAAPEETISALAPDALCLGESEPFFLDVLEAIASGELCPIPGTWLRKGDEILCGPRPSLPRLEEIPLPDRESYDEVADVRAHVKHMGIEVLAGRGCPFSCTYCINELLRSRHDGTVPYCRKRPLDMLFGELEYLKKHYAPVPLFGFHDDCFTLDKRWLATFCEEYPQKIAVPFWCNARVDTIDDEIVRMLKRAGCRRVHMGVECGSEELRRNVLNRNLSDEQIVEAFTTVRKHGLQTLAFNMIGLPCETAEDIEKTIALNRRICPTRIHVTLFTPFPGTRARELCERQGWKVTIPPSFYDPIPRIDQPSIDPATLIDYYNTFVARVLDGL